MRESTLHTDSITASDATQSTVIRSPRRATSRRMTLNMGPQHPSTHGVLRIVLELDGETILKAVPDIGFLHTGIEKECEVKTWQQVVTLTDRVDYLSNLSNNLVYALAVEKLIGDIEIPPKAQWMRVMLAEFQRLNSHLVWLGTHALDIGAMTVFFYCFREREDILRIFEMFSGQRMMTSYIRIGGLALEPPRGWQQVVGKFINGFPSKVDEYEDLLNSNPIWKRRTQGVGFVPLEDLLDLGVTGPMIRAAGMKWDVRKRRAVFELRSVRFRDPASHTENDVYARYRVRLEEMRQSARIIKQALEGMPEGAWQADAPKIVLPEREKMKTQMEALIYHFKIVTEGFRVPAGEAYQAVESPRGEIGYYVVSNGTSKPYRVFMRTPSFGNLQALPALLEGRLLADSIAVARQHGLRFGRRGSLMTFSPELEARFAKLLESYPPGRTRSAVVPMLLYAQDEVGPHFERADRRSSAALPGDAAAGGRSGGLLFDAPSQAAGQVSRAGLHQYQLPAARRRRTVRARFEDARHRPQGSDAGRAVFARRSGVHGRVLLGAGHSDQLRLPSSCDAGEETGSKA